MAAADVLAEEGEFAKYRYMQAAAKTGNTYKSMQKVKGVGNQFYYQ